MKKIVCIPDSFKGTLSSQKICSILKDRAQKHFPEVEVVSIPVADGGETADSADDSDGTADSADSGGNTASLETDAAY